MKRLEEKKWGRERGREWVKEMGGENLDVLLLNCSLKFDTRMKCAPEVQLLL